MISANYTVLEAHSTRLWGETHNLALIMSSSAKGSKPVIPSASVVALARGSLAVVNDASNDVVYEGWLLKKKRKKMQGLCYHTNITPHLTLEI